ncbi:MAG TPA: peptidase S8 [Candidatus Aminicenantes bacterium]|nr:peptidase S8 [Candidatus Aminicenantes bacterium]HEB36010.1 peptidase S8 [Candidatus Aminicenantes bacterium]
MPKKIFAQASPRSVGGVSMFDALSRINAETVHAFASDPNIINRATVMLQEAGFEILQVTSLTINIAGSQKTYEKAFNTKLITEERPVIKELGREDTATFIECPDTDLRGLISTAKTAFKDVLEGIAIEEPNYLMAESMYPPNKEYWHLRVPAGVSLATNADKAHRAGITGQGIKIAMVDTGHYKHRWFVGRGYRVAPVVLAPGSTDPLKDDHGHGTGESANIFAVAPDAELLPVKWNYVNSTAAINTAVGLQPDIITCSWGHDKPSGNLTAADQAAAAAIAAAVASGIIVVFAAGNGQWGFPGQHPDVISAGGVFMDIDESLWASDYASGFMSNIYPGRQVPDLCGLVGMRPGASYIMLPIQPNCTMDQIKAGGTHPPGDETASDDGWAAFSGTSAAAPQLAGVAALIKQACARLTPAQVRDIMKKTARDVTQGNCHPNTGANPAIPGPDDATGYGLVNAHKATLMAKLRCISIRPIRSIGGISRATLPRGPSIGSIQPRGPSIGSIQPRGPITRAPQPPTGPITGPISPVRPREAAELTDLELASLETQLAQQPQLSEEDVEMLEKMLLESDPDITDE